MLIVLKTNFVITKVTVQLVSLVHLVLKSFIGSLEAFLVMFKSIIVEIVFQDMTKFSTIRLNNQSVNYQ